MFGGSRIFCLLYNSTNWNSHIVQTEGERDSCAETEQPAEGAARGTVDTPCLGLFGAATSATPTAEEEEATAHNGAAAAIKTDARARPRARARPATASRSSRARAGAGARHRA